MIKNAESLNDVYALTKTQNFNIKVLREAIRRTAEHRGSVDQIKNALPILASLADSKELANYWRNYGREYEYARDISFSEILTVLREVLQSLSPEKIE